MNKHNKKLAEQGRKRRARLLRDFDLGITIAHLAEKHGISRQRIQKLIGEAKQDSVRL